MLYDMGPIMNIGIPVCKDLKINSYWCIGKTKRVDVCVVGTVCIMIKLIRMQVIYFV